MDTPSIKKKLLYHLRQLRPLVDSNCSDDEDEAAFHEMERLVARLPNEEASPVPQMTRAEIERAANDMTEAELPDNVILDFGQRAYRGSFRKGCITALRYANERLSSHTPPQPVHTEQKAMITAFHYIVEHMGTRGQASNESEEERLKRQDRWIERQRAKDPPYKDVAEFGHLLMRPLSSLSPDERRRYNDLRVILTTMPD